MNIDAGYRRITIGETVLGTDIYDRPSGRGSFLEDWPKMIGEILKPSEGGFSTTRYGKTWQILRKIDSPWISVKERLPNKDELPIATWNGNHVSAARMTYATDGLPISDHQTIKEDKRITHWMSLPKAPEPVIQPITIQEGGSTHELIFNKDGSIKAGCVTIDKEKMTQIVERWKREQE